MDTVNAEEKLRKHMLASSIIQAKTNLKHDNINLRALKFPHTEYGQPHSGSGLHFKKMYDEQPPNRERRTLHDEATDPHSHMEKPFDHFDKQKNIEGRNHGHAINSHARQYAAPNHDSESHNRDLEMSEEGPVRPMPPLHEAPPPPPPHGWFGGGDHDYRPHGPDHGPGLRGDHPCGHGHEEPYTYPEPSLMYQTEEDPDVLKATIDLLNTPHAADNREAALAIVENIQTNCAYDYETYCAQEDASFGGLFTMVGGLPNIFGLDILFPPDATGFATGFGPGQVAGQIGTDDTTYAVDDEEEPIVVSLEQQDDYFNSDPVVAVSVSNTAKANADTDINAGGGAPLVLPAGIDDDGDDAELIMFVDSGANPEYDSGFALGGGGGGDIVGGARPHIRSSGYGVSFGMVRGRLSDAPRPPPLPRSDPEENERLRLSHAYNGPNNEYYAGGNLGYGVNGNKCMYEHRAELSLNCREAIQQAENFRHEYWQEEQDAHHYHFVGFVVVLIGIVLAVFVYKKRFSKEGKARRKATQEVHSVMESIYADPNLKNSVESAYGKVLPPLVSTLPKPPCFFTILLRMVAWFVIVCLISNSSVHITGAIFHSIVFRDDNGAEYPAPKPLVVAVLLMVICVQVLLAVLLIRTGSYLCGRCCCGTSTSTSATTNNDNASNPRPASGSTLSNAASALASYMPTIQSNLTAATGYVRSATGGFVSPNASQNGGYAPLSDDDSYYQPTSGHSAEMTTFRPTQPTAQTGVLLGASLTAPSNYAPQQAQYYTGVPVQMPPHSNNNNRYVYNNY